MLNHEKLNVQITDAQRELYKTEGYLVLPGVIPYQQTVTIGFQFKF